MPDNPMASYLTLDHSRQLRFPLWTSIAIPTQADLMVLSACESNLSGQKTSGLLTPVGIGPCLAAAGARTVVGTLWRCDAVAALCFSYYFYQFAAEDSNLPWHQVIARARRALRNMSIEGLKALREDLRLDAADECFFSFSRYISDDSVARPFEDYFYWAAFTVLGQVVRG